MKKGAAGFALTWDGARWPAARLTSRARTFLGRPLSAARMTSALQGGKVEEFRICWVPRLKGGDSVLCDSFVTPDKLRISFRVEKMVPFGDVLGVVYRKIDPSR